LRFIAGFTAICVSAILGIAVMDALRLLLKFGGSNMEQVEVREARRNRAISMVGVVLLVLTMVGLLIFRITGA
jgi:hypothetical protein